MSIDADNTCDSWTEISSNDFWCDDDDNTTGAKCLVTPMQHQTQEGEDNPDMLNPTKKLNLDSNTPTQEMSHDTHVMSHSTVIEMFNQIQRQLKQEREEDRKSLMKFKTTIMEEVAKTASEATEQVMTSHSESEEIKKMKEELTLYKQKTEILTQVCERFHVQVNDLTQKIENIELNNARKALIITGLSIASTKKNDMIQEVADFLEQTIDVQVQIDDIYTIGLHPPKPIVLSLPTFQQKQVILNNKSKLQSYEPAKVFINEYVPTITQEKRRREKEIVSAAEQSELEVNYVKGKIQIQGQVFKSPISVPSPKDLVNLSTQELQMIQKLNIKKGTQIQQENNIFTPYIAKVNTYQQIRYCYIKMKIIEPMARHIPCAYVIPGAEKHYTNAFLDDEEPGSGRVLYQALKRADLVGYVVFVARKYGGTKIGPDRFTNYYKALAQMLQIPLTRDNKKMTNPKPPRQNARGAGYRGRGGAIRGGHTSTQYRKGAGPILTNNNHTPNTQYRFANPTPNRFETKQSVWSADVNDDVE